MGPAESRPVSSVAKKGRECVPCRVTGRMRACALCCESERRAGGIACDAARATLCEARWARRGPGPEEWGPARGCHLGSRLETDTKLYKGSTSMTETRFPPEPPSDEEEQIGDEMFDPWGDNEHWVQILLAPCFRDVLVHDADVTVREASDTRPMHARACMCCHADSGPSTHACMPLPCR